MIPDLQSKPEILHIDSNLLFCSSARCRSANQDWSFCLHDFSLRHAQSDSNLYPPTFEHRTQRVAILLFFDLSRDEFWLIRTYFTLENLCSHCHWVLLGLFFMLIFVPSRPSFRWHGNMSFSSWRVVWKWQCSWKTKTAFIVTNVCVLFLFVFFACCINFRHQWRNDNSGKAGSSWIVTPAKGQHKSWPGGRGRVFTTIPTFVVYFKFQTVKRWCWRFWHRIVEQQNSKNQIRGEPGAHRCQKWKPGSWGIARVGDRHQENERTRSTLKTERVLRIEVTRRFSGSLWFVLRSAGHEGDPKRGEQQGSQHTEKPCGENEAGQRANKERFCWVEARRQEKTIQDVFCYTLWGFVSCGICVCVCVCVTRQE